MMSRSQLSIQNRRIVADDNEPMRFEHNMTNSGDQLRTELTACPDRSELEAMWREVEQHAEPSFFTSWSWIGCWLDHVRPHQQLKLLCAKRGRRVVGVGLIVCRHGACLRFLASQRLYLHATGDPDFDDVTIEHNGLLTVRDGADAITNAMLEYLCALRPAWQQLYFPGLMKVPPFDAVSARDFVIQRQTDVTHFVDLASVRQAGGDYLMSLSANSRAQVRQSLKKYQALGPVTVTSAGHMQEALQFLECLKELHQRHWSSKGLAGAFANPRFVSFHNQLIRAGFPRGEVQLIRVHAGVHDIGYLYSFVHRSRVFCYQSGFNYGLVGKGARPGLTSHALAIQHCVDAGLEVYDFLAGDSQYKRQLASHSGSMTMVSIHRRTPLQWLETQARALRDRIRVAIAAVASGRAAPMAVAPRQDRVLDRRCLKGRDA